MNADIVLKFRTLQKKKWRNQSEKHQQQQQTEKKKIQNIKLGITMITSKLGMSLERSLPWKNLLRKNGAAALENGLAVLQNLKSYHITQRFYS